jgi:hypothetical protein
MNLIQYTEGNYPFDPLRNFHNLEKYINKNCEKINFIYGANYMNGKIYKNYKNICMDFEEPNFHFDYNLWSNKLVKNEFNKKLTLCPYTAKKNKSWVDCFFPTDIEFIHEHINLPNFENKDIDVIYIGNDVSNLVSQFKKRSINIPIPSYLDKINTLYKCKISICHNLIFLDSYPSHYYENIIKVLPELDNKDKIIPQLKSRIFESGFSKCIPLVYYDDFKIIENYFTPNVDFLYFKNLTELDDLIHNILCTYDEYKYIAENIYNKCMKNYKLQDFVTKFIN